MPQMEDNKSPHLTLTDGSAPATPDSGHMALFGSNSNIHQIDDGGSITNLTDRSTGGSTFKSTVVQGQGTYSTTSATMVAIDGTNLAYLTFTLSVGDVVRCTLTGTSGQNTGQGGFDFEVDQPTSGNVFIGAGSDYGLAATRSSNREVIHITGMFTATEAGSHGFRPAYRAESGFTARIANAASGTEDTAITFVAEDLGAPA